MSILSRALLLVLAFLAPAGLAASPATAAAARHYDCSKAGNANKAACKSAATAPKAIPTTTTTSTVTTKTTARHYDCTKPGNANKAVCRTASTETATGKAPEAVKTTTKTVASTTDCTKWYNRLRATCRTTSSATPAKTTVKPARKPAPAATSAAAANDNGNPAGATAQCKDGTYSHAKTHQGACSHHGGVAKWL